MPKKCVRCQAATAMIQVVATGIVVGMNPALKGSIEKYSRENEASRDAVVQESVKLYLALAERGLLDAVQEVIHKAGMLRADKANFQEALLRGTSAKPRRKAGS